MVYRLVPSYRFATPRSHFMGMEDVKQALPGSLCGLVLAAVIMVVLAHFAQQDDNKSLEMFVDKKDGKKSVLKNKWFWLLAAGVVIVCVPLCGMVCHKMMANQGSNVVASPLPQMM